MRIGDIGFNLSTVGAECANYSGSISKRMSVLVGDSTPGGISDAYLMEDNFGYLMEDGSSYYLLESN